MAAIFNALKDVVKIAAPITWNIARPLIDTGVNFLANMDMDDRPRAIKKRGVNYFNMTGTLDDPISERDRNQEEVLVVTHAELTQRELLQFAQEQMKVEEYAFQMPLSGLVKSSVVLSLHVEYTFSNEATNFDIKNVNYNDHVYIHMMPKKFAFYDYLLQHDLFRFSNMNIKASNTSGLDTSTMIGFLPVTTDTSDCSNGLLMQLCKKLEADAADISYNVRYVSPDVVTYDINEKKDYVNIKSKYMFLEPNKIIKTDNVIDLEKEENTNLSYGTIIIVKQNVGQIVGMSFNINMEFDVWDYVINGIKLSEIKDRNLNGVNDEDEGQSNGNTRPAAGSSRSKVGRRTQKQE